MKRFPEGGKLDKTLSLFAMLGLACFLGAGVVLAWELVTFVIALESRSARALALVPVGFAVLMAWFWLQRWLVEHEEKK